MYAIPAGLAWLVIGVLLNVISLRHGALVLMLVYCAYYGVQESGGLHGIRPPSTSWQVPKTFVHAASWQRRVIVWGALLGPGLATRNPYAGFGLLPIAIATVGLRPAGLVVAFAIGVSHATGRALALLRDVERLDESDYYESVLRSMRWRRVDGFALLGFGGFALLALIAG